MASVAYGMRADDLVFWLDVLPEGSDAAQGALCRRHADTMVVPRGWTLDDLRDPDLHLFRPPRREPPQRSASTRSSPRARVGEQLTFAADVDGADRDVAGGGDADDMAAATPAATEPAEPAESTVQDSWTPSFDEADDLDGLLSAQSPLLSRAFRTADRNDR